MNGDTVSAPEDLEGPILLLGRGGHLVQGPTINIDERGRVALAEITKAVTKVSEVFIVERLDLQ